MWGGQCCPRSIRWPNENALPRTSWVSLRPRADRVRTVLARPTYEPHLFAVGPRNQHCRYFVQAHWRNGGDGAFAVAETASASVRQARRRVLQRNSCLAAAASRATRRQPFPLAEELDDRR